MSAETFPQFRPLLLPVTSATSASGLALTVRTSLSPEAPLNLSNKCQQSRDADVTLTSSHPSVVAPRAACGDLRPPPAHCHSSRTVPMDAQIAAEALVGPDVPCSFAPAPARTSGGLNVLVPSGLGLVSKAGLLPTTSTTSGLGVALPEKV